MATKIKIALKYWVLMLFGGLLLMANTVRAQDSSSANKANNEIRFNLLGLAIGLPELSYERLWNENMGIGISAAAGIQKDNGTSQEYKFIIMPHYHYYLGKKQANGFFLEANTTVFRDDKAQADDGGVRKDKIYYGLGAALGYKQLFGKGIVAEFILGLGKTLNNKPVKNKGVDLGLYPRLGLSIGKRFYTNN